MCLNVGGSDDLFTVELHHGGFFVGSGQLRTYVNGKISWFDNCDTDTWSPLWFEDFFEQLGYTDLSNLKVYWLLPGKDLADGLRIVTNDSDTNAMASVVDRVKTLVVYIDHDESFRGIDWDDVVINPSAKLPKVFSPCKGPQVEKNVGERLPDFSKNLRSMFDEQQNCEAAGTENGSGSDDSEDSDFVDSDNEVDHGDDDLFADYVDVDVIDEGAGKGKKTGRTTATKNFDGENESSDDEGLYLPNDEGQVNLNFKNFTQEDLNNPAFKVGMVFESVEMLRKEITEYSLKNRVNIKIPRNDQRRIRAHCAVGCPWTLYASKNSRVKAL